MTNLSESSQYNTWEPQGWRLILPNIPPNTLSQNLSKTVSETRPFHLNLTGTILPTIGFTIERLNHIFKYREITGRIDYGAWTTTFIIDEKLDSYTSMFKWLQFIDANQSDQDRHSKREYLTDGYLSILSNYRIQTNLFKFINLSPTRLGQVSLDYSRGEMVISSDITFEYDYIKLIEN